MEQQINTKRCLGCMEEFDPQNGPCPCGFRIEQYKREESSLIPGTTLENGRYTIGRVLGQGGFGITYIGFDRILGKIAIKEFFPENPGNDYIVYRDVDRNGPEVEIRDKEIYKKGLDDFVREAQILAELSGLDGVVNVRTWLQENNTAYLVMEYVDGISAKAWVKKNGPIPADMVLRMMKRPIQALSEVHKKQLVHRDISADNILIRPDGKVTLIDFGAARMANMQNDRTLTIICKPGFSAYEQYYGKGKKGKLGPWSDVYGMCATIYYMITGERPPDSGERIVDDPIRSLIPDRSTGLSREICDAIMKGLAVEYKDRFQNMEELFRALYGEALSSGNILDSDVGSSSEKKGDKTFSRSFQKRKLQKYREMPETGILRELKEKRASQKKRKYRKRICVAAGAAVAAAIVIVFVCFLTGLQRTADGNGADTTQAVATQIPEEPAYDTKKPVVSAGASQTQEVKKADSQLTDTPVSAPQTTKKSSHTRVQKIKMPDLYGMTRKAAVNKLLAWNIRYVLIYKRTSEIKKGRVYRTSIRAGKVVDTKKEVGIYISSGAPATAKTPEPMSKPTAAPVVTAAPKKTAKPKKTPKNKYAGDLDSFLY